MAVLPPALSSSETRTWHRVFGLQRLAGFPVMCGILLVGFAFLVTRGFSIDPDVWWHLKVGQEILQSHHWPEVDPYSFTAHGTPWMAYEWLGEIVLALVERLGGLHGLWAFQFLLASAILLALYFYGVLQSGNSKAGFAATAVLLLFAAPSFSLRPQMLGYLFLLVLLIALARFRKGKPRALWCLPFLFLIWVNVHGSFIIGVGVVGLYLVSGLAEFRLGGIESSRWTQAERVRLELALLLSLAALMITPYGTRVAMYPFDMAFNQPLNVAHIREWQPMPFGLFPGKAFLIIILGFFLAQTAFRFTWRMEELLLGIGGIAAATVHVRFILLFVPFFTPLLATSFGRYLRPYRRSADHYILNLAIMVIVLGLVAHYLPSKADVDHAVANNFPVAAFEYLQRNRIAGPMYNTYGYGGYLIWAADDPERVFVDGRVDLYERTGVLADYLAIAGAQRPALALLRSYRIQTCLIERNEPLGTLLAASTEWKNVYQDRMAAVFVRVARPPQSE